MNKKGGELLACSKLYKRTKVISCITLEVRTIMDIKELRALRNKITTDLISISELIEEKTKDANPEKVNENMKNEMIGDVLKITIDDYPPKISVYERDEVVDGRIVSHTYKKVRDRVYRLVGNALKGYKGERIDPAVVHIVYYVPVSCDVGNFLGKMIVNSLMYSGAIGKDDNLEHVPIEASKMIIDKDNPRIEIYVSKYSEKLEQNMLPWTSKK